ncbi:MAG: ribosomal subunit interface protein [Candidatus Colwellbacteria bacterium CG10_big_fil_rev_8_21_14_0_10_42_22]|uniref:Ribosomal subunit interface protein n=1 Tax=Candidatus Colwellbacteria bacterium CG10_big_fil_rev_8_21_14_0_10_42_22 TaxID=1974540 RepID=A0A2H0VHR0_9BACT|nr:MAG: ribosomal subunit interface protein [Candidatus Colwellbacteria bacterium CG10_big_fil_rev_8_21_14_0_10_42_22]
MTIDIIANGIELTDPLREYVNMKIGSLEKYLKSYGPENLRIDVEVARTTQHHRHGDVFYAEANLNLPGKLLRATHEASDIRVAIDKVKDTLQREIRKYKDQH